MKYLVIGALLALVFLFLYSRLRPYIQFCRKVLAAMKGPVGIPSVEQETRRQQLEKKLLRCVACGTWIPADRAIGTSSGLSVYCSRVCFEQGSSGNLRKVAG